MVENHNNDNTSSVKRNLAPIIIGFSGSRQSSFGEQTRQYHTLCRLIYEVSRLIPRPLPCFDLAIHGCCHGWDRRFHTMILTGNYTRSVEGYPSNPEQHEWASQYDWAMGRCSCLNPILPPLERNRIIAIRSTYFFACPSTDTEVLRSGTWTTIRRRRETGRHLAIALPNGQAIVESSNVNLGTQMEKP